MPLNVEVELVDEDVEVDDEEVVGVCEAEEDEEEDVTPDEVEESEEVEEEDMIEDEVVPDDEEAEEDCDVVEVVVLFELRTRVAPTAAIMMTTTIMTTETILEIANFFLRYKLELLAQDFRYLNLRLRLSEESSK